MSAKKNGRTDKRNGQEALDRYISHFAVVVQGYYCEEHMESHYLHPHNDTDLAMHAEMATKGKKIGVLAVKMLRAAMASAPIAYDGSSEKALAGEALRYIGLLWCMPRVGCIDMVSRAVETSEGIDPHDAYTWAYTMCMDVWESTRSLCFPDNVRKEYQRSVEDHSRAIGNSYALRYSKAE